MSCFLSPAEGFCRLVGAELGGCPPAAVGPLRVGVYGLVGSDGALCHRSGCWSLWVGCCGLGWVHGRPAGGGSCDDVAGAELSPAVEGGVSVCGVQAGQVAVYVGGGGGGGAAAGA